MKSEKIDKKNTNYVAKNRHWISIERHAIVVGKAMIIGAIFSFVQYFINYFGFSFKKEAENAILFIPMAFAFFIYVIFAAYAANRVLDESKEVSRTIIEGDLDTFLVYRDEQLPILILLPLGASGSIIILFALFFPFPDEVIGVTAVFAVVFIMTLIFKVTNELDRYENSVWFREKTPSDWWEIDIEEYFKNKKKEKQ